MIFVRRLSMDTFFLLYCKTLSRHFFSTLFGKNVPLSSCVEASVICGSQENVEMKENTKLKKI